MMMKKALSAILVTAMLLPLAACNKQAHDTTATSDRVETSVTTENTSSQEDKKGYAIEDIKLTKDTRSWSCPDDRYKAVLEAYGGNKCSGTMLVATDDDIIYLYAEDAVEKDGKTLVSQDTVFDIASVSKVFTAVCILQLKEQGKLDISDTLDKYFPGYETGKKISIYNLLHMNSGIPDYLNAIEDFWGIKDEKEIDQKNKDILTDKTTDEELLEALYKAPLYFEPGTDKSYSNTNYRLLALIIEKITGTRYCDYVKENIFDKCGMTKTTSMTKGDMTYVPYEYQDMLSSGITDENGYPICPNNCRGDGGIHSNLTDMIKFDRALFGGKLLSSESMDILLTEDRGYCCGLNKNEDGYSHDGSSITCTSDNKVIRSDEFGHIYIIRFEHAGMAPDNEEDNPLKDTNYTKGTFENGIYINEYARLKVRIPEGYEALSESECIKTRNGLLLDIKDSKDKLRESNNVIDASFWNAMKWNCYEFNIFNVGKGVPDDPDYTADKMMDDEIRLYKSINNDLEITELDRVKVTLCGEEYIRSGLKMIDDGDTGYMYFYTRKLDDDLMCFIVLSTWSDNPVEDFERSFE